MAIFRLYFVFRVVGTTTTRTTEIYLLPISAAQSEIWFWGIINEKTLTVKDLNQGVISQVGLE